MTILPVETVAHFDAASDELPGGIAFGSGRTMYVGLAPLGEIRRLEVDGSWASVFRVDPGEGGIGILGLAADRSGALYAAAPSDAPGAHGVWTIVSANTATRLAGSERIAFPSALALDPNHNLYVTDGAGGAIWRIPPRGPAEHWCPDNPLIETGEITMPVPRGISGVAYFRGRLLVANAVRRHLIEIPIAHTGAAGTPRILRAFDGPLDVPVDIEVDVAGNAYVLVAGRNEVVRLERSGEVTTIATAADGVCFPVAMTMGPPGSTKRRLYVANLSRPAFTLEPKPSVIAIEVPLSGLHPG